MQLIPNVREGDLGAQLGGGKLNLIGTNGVTNLLQTPINPMPYHPIQYCKHFDVLPQKMILNNFTCMKRIFEFSAEMKFLVYSLQDHGTL